MLPFASHSFFAPRSWVSGRNRELLGPNASYPGAFPCCDTFQKDHESREKVCGGSDPSTCARAPRVNVDKSWLEEQLRAVLAFRERFQKPVWIDVRAQPLSSASVSATPGR